MFNQAGTVVRVTNQVKAQREKMQQNWQSQLTRQPDHFNNLWNLVRVIPEMKSEKPQIEKSLDQLKLYKDRLPQSGMDLQFYFQLVNSLETRLTGAEGLCPIKTFLAKLTQNRLTFAGIDEEVLPGARIRKEPKLS